MITGSKYVPVFQIINQVYRDLGSTDFNIADALEWAGEAMEFIGAAPVYLPYTYAFKVVNRRVKLPIGLHYIEQVKGYPTEDLENCPLEQDYYPMTYSTSSSAHRYCEANQDCNTCHRLTYTVNDDFINPSFDTGFLLISFNSIALDKEGNVLIPDDVKFKNAVSYHIQEKVAFKMLIGGKIQGDVYQIISKNRDYYIGAANSRGNMPSIDQMETIKNDWLRLIPKLNHHADNFISLGIEEQRINHTTRIKNSSSHYGNPTFFYHT